MSTNCSRRRNTKNKTSSGVINEPPPTPVMPTRTLTQKLNTKIGSFVERVTSTDRVLSNWLILTISWSVAPVFEKPMVDYLLTTFMFFDIRDILTIANAGYLHLFRRLPGDGSRFCATKVSTSGQPSRNGEQTCGRCSTICRSRRD